MEVHVPAMRGKMGTRTYYACLMPMNAVPQFFKFTDWAGISPEDREQRVLNVKRVPDLAAYMTENEDDYLFSSITASYKSEPKFEPFAPGENIGMLKLRLGDELVINDGQHRAAGIVQALKDGSPSIRDDTLSVLLFPWESTDRVQQMFSDLNRFVQKTSKSLDILYDKRDDTAAATLAMIEKVPVFKELTEKEKVSLETKSTKLFTLAALYDANRGTAEGPRQARHRGECGASDGLLDGSRDAHAGLVEGVVRPEARDRAPPGEDRLALDRASRARRFGG